MAYDPEKPLLDHYRHAFDVVREEVMSSPSGQSEAFLRLAIDNPERWEAFRLEMHEAVGDPELADNMVAAVVWWEVTNRREEQTRELNALYGESELIQRLLEAMKQLDDSEEEPGTYTANEAT